MNGGLVEFIQGDIKNQPLRHCRGKIVTKMCPFTNDDAPKYLRKLQEIEDLPLESKIVVK
jgi:hypothetical protein